MWPWLAVAGVGALHGLNPTTGWAFAAAWGVRSRDRSRAWRALLPIGLGHAVSVTAVATTVAFGFTLQPGVLLAVAAGLLMLAAALHASRSTARRVRAPMGHAGLALWSFMMATAHGAGLMLVPALLPLCLNDGPARQLTATGPLSLALAAVGVHMAAMLAVTALMAASACSGIEAGRRWLRVLPCPERPHRRRVEAIGRPLLYPPPSS
jgi:hypothetical protein